MATALARISKGEIPDKITVEYQGDFNTLKENLNLLIDAMNDITGLAQETSHGKFNSLP
jgi:methyl-accepting chemotaxis protein